MLMYAKHIDLKKTATMILTHKRKTKDFTKLITKILANKCF